MEREDAKNDERRFINRMHDAIAKILKEDPERIGDIEIINHA
jgi:hypothetical protein